MMSDVSLVWSTPDAEALLTHMARVSNKNATNEASPKLINYLIKNGHWSPFEMVNACMEINTTRDIARQILRHRSFSFQEFSQRYAEVEWWQISESRLQDTKNRQNSLPSSDEDLNRWWREQQIDLWIRARATYGEALERNIAKEVARKILPEGLTMSKMYMNGTLRSWMHYVDVRCHPSTQKEHREVAEKCKHILKENFPYVFSAISTNV